MRECMESFEGVHTGSTFTGSARTRAIFMRTTFARSTVREFNSVYMIHSHEINSHEPRMLKGLGCKLVELIS